MGFAFNPFTGNFDAKGSGGGGGAQYIDGEVATYNDLPLDGTAPLNSAWLVRTASGVWPVSRKQAGIYIRTATGGSSRDADYTYAGTMPDVFSDSVFLLYDEASTTRTGQFNLGSITAGQNRVLTWPDASGTIARTEDFAAPPAIGSTTAAAGTFTSLKADSLILPSTGAPLIYLNTSSGQVSASSFTGGSYTTSSGGTYTIASGGALVFNSGSSVSGQIVATNGTITASAPVLDLSQTWNNGSVNFTAVRINVTNTASQFSGGLSNLLDIQLGGSPAFFVRTSGNANASGFTTFGGGALSLNSQAILVADASNALAQRNGTNAQTFRIYNTFTSATNFERLNIIAQSAGSVIIGTEKGSGGGTARALELQTDGVTRLTVQTTGTVALSSHLTVENGFIRIASAQAFQWLNRSKIYSLADGNIGLYNAGESSFNLLQFGGTTSSFPALKRSSTTLQVRLADDSADAPLSCGAITASGALLRVDNAGATYPDIGSNTYPTNGNNGRFGTAYVRYVNVQYDVSILSGGAFGLRAMNTRLLSLTDKVLDFGAHTQVTGAHTLNVYNVYSGTTSYERARLGWAANEFIIDAEAGSGGGTLRGIKIGSATSSLLGFYGATPVDRPATVADPAGGGTVDTEARTAINDIIDRLQELGLIA